MFINGKYRAILSFSESFSWYFHLATVNSRGVIVMVNDILKRLDTIFKAGGTDGLEVHTTLLEDKMVVVCNHWQPLPKHATTSFHY